VPADSAPPAPSTAAARPPADAAPEGGSARLRAAAGSWEALLVGLLVVTAIVGQAISSEFLTTDSFSTGSLVNIRGYPSARAVSTTGAL